MSDALKKSDTLKKSDALTAFLERIESDGTESDGVESVVEENPATRRLQLDCTPKKAADMPAVAGTLFDVPAAATGPDRVTGPGHGES